MGQVKIITGGKPSVQKKEHSMWVHDGELLVGGLSHLDIVDHERERVGIPPEAVVSREDDLPRMAVRYRWEWWEVTI